MKLGQNYKEYVPFADDESDPPSIERQDFEDEESFRLVLKKGWEKAREGDWCELYQEAADFEISVMTFEWGRKYHVVKIRWDRAYDHFCCAVFDNAEAAKRQFDAWVKRASEFISETDDNG
jgi:hypothetical protein